MAMRFRDHGTRRTYLGQLDLIERDKFCENCGSLGHITARCTKRDDAVMGTETPGRNGEYQGPLEVRHLPPGFSFAENPFELTRPSPMTGQVWRSPNGMLFAIHAVEDGMVTIKRLKLGSAGICVFPRVPLARFTARYRFVRAR